jgi:pyruvate formate lyase activating enzyme
MITAPIFGISRLRMGTDGPGITTLVTFMGCPLQCKYCLNDFCHKPVFETNGKTPSKGVSVITPQDLYDKVKIDNLYFGMTGGGICFGGGEPALQWRFIRSFRKICGREWKITLETCLHYNEYIIKELSKIVDLWIVDIKSMEPIIFEEYTGVKVAPLFNRLKFLRDIVGEEKVVIKIPFIPEYKDEHSVKWELSKIKAMGFTHIEQIEYIKRLPNNNPQN